jgi:hypothetical protein
LQGKGIEPPFIASLLADIAAVQEKSSAALHATTNKAVATRAVESAEQTLTQCLRELQNAGRQAHGPYASEKLQGYLVGERIADNRAMLDQSAQTILRQANADRPPGVDTEILSRVEAERAALQQEVETQRTALTQAQNERAARNAMVESIKQRCCKIQLAADRAWPYGEAGHAAARRDFRLPATRPYTA